MKNQKTILSLTAILGIFVLSLFISTAAWAASPVIFYSDLTAGPNTGGQNNNGVFVTIWGNNFGATQGSSTITVGGGQVNNYPTWTNTMICFQLGGNAATGNIVLNTSNGNATGPTFTVQSGNIYFVQPGATTNGSGTYASPFSHLYYAESISNPGDTIYVLAGTIYDEVNGHQGWHSLLIPDHGGSQGSPISYIAYPNASVILKADGGTDLYSNGSASDGDTVQYIFRAFASWITVSKFTLQMTGTSNMQEAIAANSDGLKIVGNNITALTYTYGLVETGSNYSQILGNEIHDSGASQSFNNEDHSIYWDAGGNPVTIAWNYLHGNINSGWEISCFHQGSTSEPTRVGAIHDNLIIAGTGGSNVKGILLGDVDSGETQADVEAQNIKVYNNILVNLGLYEYGGAIQAVSGTAYIYNNTIYGSGTETMGMIQFPTGGIGPNGGSPVWYVANNIIYNLTSSSLYLSDGNGNAPNMSNFALLTNNNYYGAGSGPSQDTKAVNANPQFVANGSNFQLQSTSPDINVGYNTTSIVASDFSGLVRSSTPSIGAYELTGSSAAPSPIVTITSPSNGSSASSGSNVTITVTASESNGTIKNISLYNGAVLLGSSSSSPYNYAMNNAAAGTYTLTAVATDANGVSTTSSPVSFTVTAQSVLPSTPVVAITSPVGGSSFTAGSNITITTTASETNGTINNISLYNGSGVLLGSSSTSPFNFVYTNVLAGTYTFTAQATDANGVSVTSSPVTITVTAPVVASTPVVTVSADKTSYVAPATVILTASASETNGSISKIAIYYNGSNLLGTGNGSVYSYTATSVSAGTYTVTAVATDANGVSVTSTPITVVVSTTAPVTPSAPVVALTSPTSGSNVVAGSNITMTATASETNGTISKVAFYNGSTLLGTATSSPYSFTWSNVAAGSYSLVAVATDATGVSVTSSAVAITVTAPVSLPVVALTSPASGSNFTAGSNVTLTASASETNGTISKVAFYNGSTLLGTTTSSPYSFTWSNVAAGNYTLTAIAYDNNSKQTTSIAVPITVTGIPTVSLASNNTSFTAPANIVLTAAASEANGTITQVAFYNGSTLLGTATTSPYTFTWSNVAAGSYTLTAIATDANGDSATSSAVAVTVTAPVVAPTPVTPSASAPVVTVSADKTSYTAPATIILTASASEKNGSISKVAIYYNGSNLLGSGATSTYSYTATSVAAGTYTVTAVATDANGVSVTSSPITVVVTSAATTTKTTTRK